MNINHQNIETLLIESQYFGNINSTIALFYFSNIKIEQYDTYHKMSFRNRCVLPGSNGLVHLSVPLEKGRNRQRLMKDTRISYSGRWQAEHLRTIESCYRRSPFFEYYWEDVQALTGRKESFLLDLNMAILAWLQKTLKFTGTVSLTDFYQKEYTTAVMDRRDHILPKNFQDQPVVARYTQVFEERIGFQPNMSILDLLFCCGPDMKNVLKDNKLTF